MSCIASNEAIGAHQVMTERVLVGRVGLVHYQTCPESVGRAVSLTTVSGDCA